MTANAAVWPHIASICGLACTVIAAYNATKIVPTPLVTLRVLHHLAVSTAAIIADLSMAIISQLVPLTKLRPGPTVPVAITMQIATAAAIAYSLPP